MIKFLFWKWKFLFGTIISNYTISSRTYLAPPRFWASPVPMATLNFDLDFKRGREKGEREKKKKKWAESGEENEKAAKKKRKVNNILAVAARLAVARPSRSRPGGSGPVHGQGGHSRPHRLLSPHGRSEGSLLRLFRNYLEHLVRVPLPPPS